ncbi:uncharacterized protein TNIN_374171 [Trichonephila inaurata madagascariensis]|uniref:Protein sleepless n=1 Tax=Trichonephila inaurata madagascariensis TaxID=2747483 RepID=A0A8X6YXL5_9ARAC|nr:uncharacterized protein TNIN_374171 [Trichonephila inaurata madagascariensis]
MDMSVIVMSSRCFIAGILVLFGLIKTGLCIECYRCNSTGNLDCLEKFMYPNPLRAESCSDVFEALYCIKTTGIYKGEIGTRRFCSSRDLGNFCEFFTHSDKREYKGCVYTCGTDGCNTAPTNFQAPPFTSLIAFTIIATIFHKSLL